MASRLNMLTRGGATALLMALGVNFVAIHRIQAYEFIRTSDQSDRIYNYRQNKDDDYVPEGTKILVESKDADIEKILLKKDESLDFEVVVTQKVYDNDNDVAIPAGSIIEGTFEPAEEDGEDGTQFVAKKIIFNNGDDRKIKASSNIITSTETIDKDSDTENILTGALIGSAAMLLLEIITGDGNIKPAQLLIWAGIGGIAGELLGGGSQELLSVDPNEDLDLFLDSNFFSD